MDQDQDQEEQSQAEQEHNFPGSAAEEQNSPGGAMAALADVAEIADVVPLLGTAANLIKAGYDGGSALAHADNATDAYNAGDGRTGSSEIDKADESERAMTGDFINAIPLVGTARALM